MSPTEVYAAGFRRGYRRPPSDGPADSARLLASPAMHELSIANRVVELVTERVREAGPGRVAAITLRIGALSCVHEDALRFGFDLVREGTPASDAELRIVKVPVTIWCAACEREFALPDVRKFTCPACGVPSGDIRAGRELDLEAIELTDEATAG
ncbi:MAG: hydrogenase maturation nickel metallochaperone HypA [Planctomycetota bacterium]